MTYRTGDLYYQFKIDDEGNLENLYETLSANLNIYKQDINEELELNDDLYYKNLYQKNFFYKNLVSLRPEWFEH